MSQIAVKPREVKGRAMAYTSLSDRLKREPELIDNKQFMGKLSEARERKNQVDAWLGRA